MEREAHASSAAPPAAAAADRDPVCGMTVAPGTARASVEHAGRTFRFCSAHCADAFRAEPARSLAATEPTPAAVAESPEWACPLHPEVVRPAPGSCPICGMALEPRAASLDEAPSPELADMTRRLWVSAALTAPLLALAMGEMVPGLGHAVGELRALPWL